MPLAPTPNGRELGPSHPASAGRCRSSSPPSPSSVLRTAPRTLSAGLRSMRTPPGAWPGTPPPGRGYGEISGSVVTENADRLGDGLGLAPGVRVFHATEPTRRPAASSDASPCLMMRPTGPGILNPTPTRESRGWVGRMLLRRCRLQDLNLQPPVYKTGALPIAPSRRGTPQVYGALRRAHGDAARATA